MAENYVTTTALGIAGANGPIASENIQIKEDFADVIYNLTPTETPILSLCKRSTTRNTEVGWFLDRLSEAANYADTTDDAGDLQPIGEGADAIDTDFEKVLRVMNVTQIFQKTVGVTGTTESVDFYGRASEMAYQMTKKAQELKRDIETTICSKAHGMRGGAHSCLLGVTDPFDEADGMRQFANLKSQIITNPVAVQRGVDNSTSTAAEDTIYDMAGIGDALAESDINAAMEQMWINGGEPNILVCNGTIANYLAEFATSGGISGSGLSGRFRDGAQGTKLVNVVDIYVTPFGELRVVLNRFINKGETVVADVGAQNDFFLIDAEYLECCYLREPKVEDIAKTGDHDKKMLVSELTFKVLAPDGVGMVTNPRLVDVVA